MFRQIQGQDSVVAVLEDIEHYVEDGYEEELLELLDGASSVGGGILYLATTNKLEKIPKRIRCRPSRVDTLIEIPYPKEKQRKEYVEFLLGNAKLGFDLVDEIVEKSNDMSLADLKEIVISCYIYRKSVSETIERLRESKKGKEEE